MDYTALTRLCTAPRECFDVQGRITKWNSVVALLYNICGRGPGSVAGHCRARPVTHRTLGGGYSDFSCTLTRTAAAVEGFPPARKGGKRMASNGGRSFFEWLLLIAKLLGALATLLAALAEILR